SSHSSHVALMICRPVCSSKYCRAAEIHPSRSVSSVVLENRKCFLTCTRSKGSNSGPSISVNVVGINARTPAPVPRGSPDTAPRSPAHRNGPRRFATTPPHARAHLRHHRRLRPHRPPRHHLAPSHSASVHRPPHKAASHSVAPHRSRSRASRRLSTADTSIRPTAHPERPPGCPPGSSRAGSRQTASPASHTRPESPPPTCRDTSGCPRRPPSSPSHG